jgi:hypothetical protein
LADDELLVQAGTSIQVVAGIIRGEIEDEHVWLDTPVKVIAAITKVHRPTPLRKDLP